MSDLKEECFCRLQLLSTKGVTPVLVKVLEGIVRKTCNGDLDKFLKVFKKEIIKLQSKKIVNKAAFQILFPQNGKTDINSWDISLLTCILLNFCTLGGRCDRQNLIKLLEQETANNGIQAFLSAKKGILDQNIKNQITDIQYDQIYPKSGVAADIITWDFEVIVLVLAICSTGVRSQDLKDLLKPLVILETNLSQFNTDLVAFLQKHATLLNDLKESGIISNKQHELLYPTNSMYPNPNTWDQWLLVMVILNVCAHLKRCSIKTLQSLRCLRNESIAHASSPEIEESKFRTLWEKIVDNIEIVIVNEIQGYNLEQWKGSISHIRSGPLNKQESIDILKEWYKDRDELKEKITETYEKITENNEKITETIEKITKVNETVEELRLNQEQRENDQEQRHKTLEQRVNQVLKKLNDNVQVISVKRPYIRYKSRVEIQCVHISILLQGNDVAVVRRAEDSIRQAFDEELDVTKKDTAASLTVMNLNEITSITKEITKEGTVFIGIVEGSIRKQVDALAAVVGPIVEDVIKIDTDDIEQPSIVEDENQQLLEEPTDFKSFVAEKIGTYNIKYPKDTSSICAATSCVVLPTGYIVVCDDRNSTIKLFDKTFNRNDSLELENKPWDLSMSLNDNTLVLVTIPNKKCICTIKVDTILRKGKKIRVGGYYSGITCLLSVIAVSVKRNSSWEIQLLEYNGTLLKTIRPDTLHQLELELPRCVTSINRDVNTQIIISDCNKECLTALNVNTGRVEFVYKNPSLRRPYSLTSDNEDNIYVAGHESDSVHVISKTGEKKGNILTGKDGLNWPRGLCYNKLNDTLLLQPDRNKSKICVYKVVKANM